MVTYSDSLDGATIDHLRGSFFVGWQSPPSPEAHYPILANRAAIVLTRRGAGNVVGFSTAIGDGVFCAYIPHLEVSPASQGQGIEAPWWGW